MTTPSSAKRPPGIFALPFGIIVLLAGLWGGLARLTYQLPASGTSYVEHGLLMSFGFLGTLISIERAVALRRFWAWGVPAFSVIGSVWIVVASPGLTWAGDALLFAAGALLVLVYAKLDRIQRSTHNTLMGLAAVGWAVAAALAMGGMAIADTVPWIAIFLVVTITAERLELSRMLKRSLPVRVSLVVAILGMVAGATVSIWQHDIGTRFTGIAMLAMAVWLAIYDLARRTIYAKSVTRFMAAGLLAGYVWLAAGGVLWLLMGYQVGNPAYAGAAYNPVFDAEIHVIFLGFVMSMVFAHAPVIAPAVVRRPLPYFPIFYAPLALLHASLLLRVVGGDAFGVEWAWQYGGIFNEVAILAFVAATIGAFGRAAVLNRRRKAERLAAMAARAGGAASGAAGAASADVGNPTAAPTPQPTQRRSRWAVPITGGVVAIALIAAALITTYGGSSDTTPATAAPGAGSADVITAAEAQAGVAVSLVDMRIEPSHLVVAPGSHLVLNVTNRGSMHHDLHLETGPSTPLLAPGESATIDAGVISSTVDGWCTVPGHRAAGMTMSITVAPSSGSGSTGPMSTSSEMPGMSADSDTPQSSDATSPDLSADPTPGWTPIDASLPPAPDTTVHDVTWHVKNVETQVAPGVTQQLWTFNGTAPGPVLHGRVGDRFNITLVNDTDMPHNIDFHAESGPPATVMKEAAPGASRTYSFVATHAGAWLYHCSTAPMLMHIGNGMYGALIIDPPDLKPADESYVLVGSEMFFGPQGKSGDYSKMLADKPDAAAFNGYPFAYRHAPLTARVGDLVRVWVVNAGPTRSLAFHVVGAPFSTEYVDGSYRLKDGRSLGGESGYAQTLPVDPGDGGFVEMRFGQAGTYPLMTHSLADAAIGAAGEFRVSQ